MLFKKDRKILNLQQMVKNRDEVIDKKNKIIKEQELTIKGLEEIINSLKEDRQDMFLQSFENAKPKRTKKVSTNK